jgi:pimeloyl-ACP methyl ester carboxylesterase
MPPTTAPPPAVGHVGRRRQVRWWWWLPVLAALVSAAGGEPVAPSQSVVVEHLSVELDGQPQRIDVYRPAIGAPIRAAIIAHGFTRSSRRHRDLGQALAESGITAIVPDLPSVLNLWGNADFLVELAHRLEGGALGLPPLERARLVLIGTSAGGIESLVAATRLAGLAGWIGLDPVDGSGMGEEAAPTLTAPAVVLYGPNSGCNLAGSGRRLAEAIPDLRRRLVISGASHCDFEGPTNRFCEVLCGRSSADKQAHIRAETVAAARELLDAAANRTAGGGTP